MIGVYVGSLGTITGLLWFLVVLVIWKMWNTENQIDRVFMTFFAALPVTSILGAVVGFGYFLRVFLSN